MHVRAPRDTPGSAAKAEIQDRSILTCPAFLSPAAISVSSPHQSQTVGKVDGKVTVTTMVAISSDGKTLTATQTGKDAQGQTVANVIVADKQ